MCCSLQGSIEEKVLTRIACSKLMQQKIARWRKEHEDWEALAAFALSKNTGRRFKNKLQDDSNATLDASISAEIAVPQNSVSSKTALHSFNNIQDNEVFDSDSVNLGNERSDVSSVKREVNKLPKSKHQLNGSRGHHQVAECPQKQDPSDESCPSVVRRDVVVKRISLDELSDEELFLPPPDEDVSESVQAAMPSSGTKIAKGFFVVSSDEESDSTSPDSEAVVRTAASSDTDDGDDAVSNSVVRSSIKSSTMFAKSLSHRQHHNDPKTIGENKRRKSSARQNQPRKINAKKHSDLRNVGKQFTKSRGSSPNVRGRHYPRKNENFSHFNARVNTK